VHLLRGNSTGRDAANRRDRDDDDPAANYTYHNVAGHYHKVVLMADDGSETILLDLFRTNQVRERLVSTAVDGLELPPEDYPFYVLIGAEGPWTPTSLAARMEMPLSTVLFRVRRLERRGHVERTPNPDDRRSYLVRLSDAGEQLLGEARPRFRALATAVEARLGQERIGGLRGGLGELREAIEAELDGSGLSRG
jgi:DNA-binding MarR family transcriptional regulator